ncbi:amidohydrolase family protein [Virgibacillus xinjiangensis]|uniref:Amidohydrolase family protein n=1 Tax=Virgibacillus xinjiangensis TaxID=393090 RepID=A0ABV7CX38_9BACI
MKLFDAHLHIIDPRFPLQSNQGYLPDYFTCQDYLQHAEDLNVAGGAIVSGSFQGFDQSYLIDSLQKLGRQFVGVTQLPVETSDEEIIRLDKLGIRGLRFNIRRGGSEDLSQVERFAQRVHALAGWHVELYIDSRQLPPLRSMIEKLPAVSIDHLGLSKAGFPTLLSLVDKGGKVKATGFGRIDFDPREAIKEIHAINPEALMFGTDLPSTRAKRPFSPSDVDLIIEALGEKQAEQVLYKNAAKWYLKEEHV